MLPWDSRIAEIDTWRGNHGDRFKRSCGSNIFDRGLVRQIRSKYFEF